MTFLLPFAAEDAASALTSMAFPIAMIVGIFYFLMYRPQQAEEKAHKELVAGLQRGDKVITSSGIHGKLHEAKSDTLVLEVAAGQYLTVDRDVVKRKVSDTPVDPAKKA